MSNEISVALAQINVVVGAIESNADRIIELFNGDWDGDVLRSYQDCIY